MAMYLRRLLWAWPLAIIAFVLFTLYSHLEGLGNGRRINELPAEVKLQKLSREEATSYVRAVLEPHNKQHPKFDCLGPSLSRYDKLRRAKTVLSKTAYFFALNLRENLPLLPRLVGSLVEAISFLGPENCALSIVEGNSLDGTGDVLAALEPLLRRKFNLRTHFVLGNELDPLAGSRFARLAELRNLALKPMLDEPERYSDATVIFINDVAICPDDILELAYQRLVLGADMTCAMDWIYGSGDVPTFYDAYIARGITGDLFFEIPPDLTWSKATDLFWNDPESKQRFYDSLPVQVFACWNGAVAFAAEPVVSKRVAFRAAREDAGECYNGEPEIFCKDMWADGHGKIAVLPYVNLEYSNAMGEKIKKEKGYTSQRARPATSKDAMEWKPPPERVKCMPEFSRQSWQAWNDTKGNPSG